MRENKVKTIWQNGGAVINGWLGIPSAVAAENMAQCGWDSLTVDLQHGLVDYQAAVGMMQAVSTTGMTALARVPWNEPGIIMKLLDAGAFGIICPMINTRAEAEAFVGACRYAPTGFRSFGPVRAGWVHGSDYFKHANDTVLAIAMIETSKAMDNLDEILATPGLDGIYVGPADLAISLGRLPQGDPTDAVVNEAIDRICAAAKAHGVRPGIHTASPAGARNMIARGFQFTTILSDNALLANAAKATVAAARGSDANAASGPKGPY
jgi:4-hydroxy-2-oxoheptanedioate aldolase